MTPEELAKCISSVIVLLILIFAILWRYYSSLCLKIACFDLVSLCYYYCLDFFFENLEIPQYTIQKI